MSVTDWLEELGLGMYAEAFQAHDITEDILPLLTPEYLSELGVVKVGHRIKLLKAIAEFNASKTQEQQPSITHGSQPYQPAHPRTSSAQTRPSQAERRHLTVMFIDIVGSTELSTRLDPEDIRAVHAEFQAIVEAVVAQFDGFIASYMGDGVMCYFGWPTAHEDDAERAVRSGLSVIDKATKTTKPDGTPLSVRVGVASGLVVVGEIIGSGPSEEASVAGQTPNLAARMQGVAAPNQLILPNTTRQLLHGLFLLESTGHHTLKGFSEPVEAFRVIGEATRERRFRTQGPTAASTLVGRNENLVTIRKAWSNAQRGCGQVVIISGEPGVGKSRLVQTMIDEVNTQPILRVTLQCSPYHTESALYPIIHHFKLTAGLTSLDTDTQQLQKIAALQGVTGQMIPLLATLLDLKPTAGFEPPDLTPGQLRSQTLDALVEILRRQSVEAPLMIVFEDLHWIDPTSLEFLELLLECARTSPLFLLATARPEFSHSFAVDDSLQQITLNRLNQHEVMALVSHLTAHRSLPKEVSQLILDRTDGVPLFIEELTKTILESGVLTNHDGRYRLDSPLNTFAIPSTLHDSLMARLDRLQSVKQIAQTASCIGREFSFNLLQRLCNLSTDALNDAMNALVAAELVFQIGESPDSTYQFKHALVRDAAYESLLKSNRRAIHTNVLQALEEDSSTPPDLLATHAEAARLTDRAITLWEQACRAAQKRPALEEAESHVKHAIRLNEPALEKGDPAALDKAVSLQLLLGMVAAPRYGWGAQETKAVFERALDLSQRVKDSPFRYTITYGLISSHITRGEYQQSVNKGKDFIKLAEQSGDSTAIIVAHRAVGMAQMALGHIVESQRNFEFALSLFDPQKHSGLASKYGIDLGIACYSLSAINQLSMGKSIQAHKTLETCRKHAEYCDDLSSTAYLYASLSGFAIMEENDQDLTQSTQALTQLSTDHGLSSWRNWADMFNGLLLISAGDPEGVKLFEAGNDRQLASSQLYRLGTSRLSAGHRLLAVGEVALAEKYAQCTEELIYRTGEYSSLLSLHYLKAKLALERRNERKAQELIENGIALCQQQSNRLWQLRLSIQLAELSMVQNRFETALPQLQYAYDSIDVGDLVKERARAATLLEKRN